MIPDLKEQLIKSLEIENLGQEYQNKIIKILIELAWEKTLDELVEKMSEEEIEDLQKHISRNAEDLQTVWQNHQNKFRDFWPIFNTKLNQTIDEFRKSSKNS